MKNIVILTSGGDAPGMNAAIRAAVRTAYHHGLKIYGSLSGYQGLITQKLELLNPESVANCIQLGGTILKTDRSKEFYNKNTRDKVRYFLRQKNIDGLIIIGGNGTFKGAKLLQQEGGPATICIPATIDNDISNTEYTLGYDTATNTALQAIDKIRDTACSHDRNFIVEVMGRDSGFLAIDVGIAGGAEIILIPEFPQTIQSIANRITNSRKKRQKTSSIIIVAEGNQPGKSIEIANQLSKKTNTAYRVCILGHTQRGGSPTTKDRLMASRMGYMAIKTLLAGKASCMIAIQKDNLILEELPSLANNTRKVQTKDLLELNNVLCT